MSQTKTKKLGLGTSLLLVFVTFGAFVGAAAIVTQNQYSTAPFTRAEESEDPVEQNKEESRSNKEDEREGENKENKGNKSDEQDREAKDDDPRSAAEQAEEKEERARETSKKQLEGSQSNGGASDTEDEAESEKDNDSENVDEDARDDGGEEQGVFKDRAQTLEKLRQEIAESREDILEKQAEERDVTAALARLALAEAGIEQVEAAFNANNPEGAKALAKQIKKTAYFSEKDLYSAEEVAEEMTKIQKRFGQIEVKLALLESLGGNVNAFRPPLTTLRADFVALQATLTATPEAVTRDMAKAFEKRVKRLKSLVESAIFTLGSTKGNDDLFEDQEENAEDLFEDMEEVAELEEDDDNGVSATAKRVAAEHKAAVTPFKTALEKVQNRGDLAKVLLGADTDALDALNTQVNALNVRSTALETAATQVTDPQVKETLLTQATTLKSEVLKLQAYITAQNSTFSLFGWLTRLF